MSLICAAPDLYAAAAALADYYERSVNVGPGQHPTQEMLLWGALRVALAKARGEAA